MASSSPTFNSIPDPPANPADQTLKDLCVKGVDEMVQLLRHIGEHTNLVHFYSGQLNGILSNPNDIARTQAYLNDERVYLNDLWTKFANLQNTISQHFTNISDWLRVQNGVLDTAINDWKLQKLHYLQGGLPDQLKIQYENLTKMISKMEDMNMFLVKQIDRYTQLLETDLVGLNSSNTAHISFSQSIINECKNRAREVQRHFPALVQRSMIVYEEPPNIIRKGAENANKKKGTKISFEMEIRFLAGEKLGYIRENLELEALLISEQTALDIVERKIDPSKDTIPTAGRLSFPKCTLKTSDNDGLIAKIVDARITSIERATEDDASKAMHHLLFRLKHNKRTADNGGNTYLPYWAISLPFSVVINATRQAPYKRAVMFWHFGFDIDAKTSLSKRTERVRWSDFFKALDIYFKRVEQSENRQSFVMKIGLDKNCEDYLKGKIGLNKSDNVVTWEMFYKRKIDPKSTFWEWFYPIKDYVAKYSAFWESGLILGFGSRVAVEELLEKATDPSLVLKFSDSRPGKIVASYVNWTMNNGASQRVMEHVIFDEEDDEVFANKSPLECIRLSSKLQCIPFILGLQGSRKPVADFYALETNMAKRNNSRNDGYVKPGVVFVWGDQPIPPTYESQVLSPAASIESQSNYRGSDDSSNQSSRPGSVSSTFGLNDLPAYQALISSRSTAGSSRQDSIANSQSPLAFPINSPTYFNNDIELFPSNGQQCDFSVSYPLETPAPQHFTDAQYVNAHQPPGQEFYGAQYGSPQQPSPYQAQYPQHAQGQYVYANHNTQPATDNFVNYQQLPQRMEHMHMNQQSSQMPIQDGIHDMDFLAAMCTDYSSQSGHTPKPI